MSEVASDAPPSGSDAPVGPSTDEEAAFLAEQRSLDPGGSIRPPAGDPEPEPEPAVAAPLPPMDDLIKRIPTPVRDVMEELFRARFVTVKRLPQTAMK